MDRWRYIVNLSHHIIRGVYVCVMSDPDREEAIGIKRQQIDNNA